MNDETAKETLSFQTSSSRQSIESKTLAPSSSIRTIVVSDFSVQNTATIVKFALNKMKTYQVTFLIITMYRAFVHLISHEIKLTTKSKGWLQNNWNYSFNTLKRQCLVEVRVSTSDKHIGKKKLNCNRLQRENLCLRKLI